VKQKAEEIQKDLKSLLAIQIVKFNYFADARKQVASNLIAYAIVPA